MFYVFTKLKQTPERYDILIELDKTRVSYNTYDECIEAINKYNWKGVLIYDHDKKIIYDCL